MSCHKPPKKDPHDHCKPRKKKHHHHEKHHHKHHHKHCGCDHKPSGPFPHPFPLAS
jgi:hypothetical protein